MFDNPLNIAYLLFGLFFLMVFVYAVQRRFSKPHEISAEETFDSPTETRAMNSAHVPASDHFKSKASLASLGFDDDTLFTSRELDSIGTVQESRDYHELTNDDLMVVHVLAKSDHGFQGHELLQVMLMCGLRYGEMQIFHCYEDMNEEDSVLFSVASATEPGTFNLDTIASMSCKGLILFLNLCDCKKPYKALSKMLSVAEQLAEELDGDAMDDQFKLLTDEVSREYKHRMRSNEQ